MHTVSLMRHLYHVKILHANEAIPTFSSCKAFYTNAKMVTVMTLMRHTLHIKHK